MHSGPAGHQGWCTGDAGHSAWLGMAVPSSSRVLERRCIPEWGCALTQQILWSSCLAEMKNENKWGCWPYHLCSWFCVCSSHLQRMITEQIGSAPPHCTAAPAPTAALMRNLWIYLMAVSGVCRDVLGTRTFSEGRARGNGNNPLRGCILTSLQLLGLMVRQRTWLQLRKNEIHKPCRKSSWEQG